MKIKDYWGKCASCMFCDLSDGRVSDTELSFRCIYYGRSVKAEDTPCRKYKLKWERSNEEIIAFINMYK